MEEEAAEGLAARQQRGQGGGPSDPRLGPSLRHPTRPRKTTTEAVLNFINNASIQIHI
jgi:hypothetical protein